MIRARLRRPGAEDLVVVLIDSRNVERLTAGQPLRIRADQRLGLPRDVVVSYGARLEDAVNELAHAGLDVPATLLDEARRIDATP
jgi:hypothetical protein